VKLAVQFVKYVSVALLSAASDWVVFTALLIAFGAPIPAQATSRIAGAIVSFTINKYWSFRSMEHGQAVAEAWRFLLLFAASYVLSLTLFSALTFSGTSPYFSKLATDLICFMFNFMVMRMWVYRPRQSNLAVNSATCEDRSPRSDEPMLPTSGRQVHSLSSAGKANVAGEQSLHL
jgi:putative flippase GtrA